MLFFWVSLFSRIHTWVRSYSIGLCLAYFIRTMLSCFHAAINGRASFFYVAEEYFGASACFAFFFHLPIRGHLACFLVLAVINYTTVYMGVYMLPWDSDFVFFGYIPRGRIVWSYGTSVFNFVRNLILFPIEAAPTDIPISTEQRLPFLHVLPILVNS